VLRLISDQNFNGRILRVLHNPFRIAVAYFADPGLPTVGRQPWAALHNPFRGWAFIDVPRLRVGLPRSAH
jgi:hypothetical protein